MWQPNAATVSEIDGLIKRYRAAAEHNLLPLIKAHCGSLLADGGAEYRKLIELSAKMQMVGHACTELVGFSFDDRRMTISSLFAACCFLGDRFLDDYGEAVSLEYIERFQTLLTKGWFDVKSEEECIFYVVIRRLFSERDVLQPMLRQALCWLFQVQKLDVELSINTKTMNKLSRYERLSLLKDCGRDRSGHAITVLALFLVPDMSLLSHHLLYRTGSLISYIDDFGDYYFDLSFRKRTYMNQVTSPLRVLTRIFQQTLTLLDSGLPESHGRELLKGFLHRYFTTRVVKNNKEKSRQDCVRPVYE